MAKKPLESFDGVSNVVVISGELTGATGRVCRKLRRDDSAWIRMDKPLPESLRSFPEDDERGRDIVLFPEECAKA